MDCFKVLDHGFIRPIDFMGNDDSVVQAARISYGKGTKTVQDDRNLIRYLMKHRHTSPFEMCEIKVHIKAPIFITRQWVRHRTANFNEYSARYSELHNEFYYPSKEMLQKQSSINKQGRDGSFSEVEYNSIISDMKEVCELAYSKYQRMLTMNVARETARGILPVNIYTEFYWKIDVHNLMHFLKLRCETNSQQEIREYALVLLEILKNWMPITHEAFVDYNMNSVTNSRIEMEILNNALDHVELTRLLNNDESLSNREKIRLKTLFNH